MEGAQQGSGPPPAAPLSWRRADVLALLALVLAAAASLPFLTHAWYDATNDGSMYLASARALLGGRGYSFLGEPFRIRPPGMAVLLAPVLALLGQDFRALNLAVGATGVAAAALLFVLLRARIGWRFALLGALVLWTNPGFRRASTQLMSDVPGLALLLLALVVERWARRRGGRAGLAREVLLGVAIAAAAHVRTIAVLLVPAILLARLLAREPAPRRLLLRTLPFAVTAVLLLLPWAVRDARVAPEPPADQTFLHSYGTGMWHADAGDPTSPRLSVADVLARVPVRAAQILETLGSRQAVTIPSRHRFLALGEPRPDERRDDAGTRLLGALLLAASLARLLLLRLPEDLFAWLALGLLAVYFGFDDRLTLPVFVLAAGAVVELAARGAARARGRAAPLARAAVAAGLLAWAALDLRPRDGWERVRAQHEAFARIAAEVAPLLAPGERVASSVGWHHGVYLERPVWSLHWAMRRAEDGPAELAELERVIERYGIDVVLLSPLVPADRRLIPLLTRRGAGRVERTPSALLVRVRP